MGNRCPITREGSKQGRTDMVLDFDDSTAIVHPGPIASYLNTNPVVELCRLVTKNLIKLRNVRAISRA
jgi:hypothetical protein